VQWSSSYPSDMAAVIGRPSPVVVASQEARGGVEGLMTRWRIRRLQKVLGVCATMLERPDQARQARQDKAGQTGQDRTRQVGWSGVSFDAGLDVLAGGVLIGSPLEAHGPHDQPDHFRGRVGLRLAPITAPGSICRI
jgi:hypothetical protein